MPLGERQLPLAGVRVIDLTAWWAGPMAAGVLAALGADVIHIEGPTRIDGMRTTGGMTGLDGPWWERSAHYLSSNTNKRDLAIDLSRPEGLDLLKTLISAESRDHRKLLPTSAQQFWSGMGNHPRHQSSVRNGAYARVWALGTLA